MSCEGWEYGGDLFALWIPVRSGYRDSLQRLPAQLQLRENLLPQLRLWLGKIDFPGGFIVKSSKKEEPFWRFIKNIRYMNS